MRHTVDDAHAGARLDAYLAAVLPWRSRCELTSLLGEGRVQVNGVHPKKSRRMRVGDVVELILPAAPCEQDRLRAVPLHILYEDADLVVVNKPAGVAVHPAAGCHRVNLLGRLQLHYAERPAGAQTQPSVVHRLDRNTSGVIAYARRRDLVAFYTQQFEHRTATKIYLARVHGVVIGAGAWSWPLVVEDSTRVRVGAGGKPSRTEYVVRQRGSAGSLLEVRPITGRKHQIRVHAAQAGHPLVYDDVYGSDGQPEVWPAGARLGLHAHVLELEHRDGRRLRFEAPVPQQLLDAET